MKPADRFAEAERVGVQELQVIGSGRAAGPGPLAFDARLVEEAVCRALRGHQLETAFRAERDRIYSVCDPERREDAFRATHGSWFRRLRLSRPIEQALAERLEALSAVERVVVLPAAGARDEGADLFVDPAGGAITKPSRLVLCLRAETLAQPERALRLTRHELLHIADMLDPAFGYRPWLDPNADSPVYERLVRERYRVLWDTSIDGRLSQTGWAEAGARVRRWEEFSKAFAPFGAALESAFERWFDGPRPTHAELAALAASGGSSSWSQQGGRRCSLCRLPAFELLQGAELPRPVQLAVQADFADWKTQRGVCPQCADLYAARSSHMASVGLE